jgi:hypothetical protein
MLFDVRVTAFDPQAAVDPVEALMRLFKIERAFAREVVHRLPRVIKRGVPLETAQRLSQVLERIGARVEILVSERTQVGAPEKPRAERAEAVATRGEPASPSSSTASAPGTARTTLGRAGLPASANTLAQAPAAVATTASQQAQALAQSSPAAARRSMPSSVQRLEMAAALSTPAVSLPNPMLQDEAPARPVSGVLEARTARALRDQLSQQRPSLSDAQAADPRLGETRAEPRRADSRERQALHQTFDAEMPSASVRALLKSTGDDAMVGRVSLPMGSWADGAEGEDARVAATLSRASLPQSAPANETQRTGQVGLPAPKPSVKELLARRSLSQSQADGAGRGSKLPGELNGALLAPSSKFTLPMFAARGSSVADEIEELPGALELRRKRAALTWGLLLLASLVTAGLFGLLTLFKIVSRRRRRQAELRELQASALLVNQQQLPELYNCVKQLAIRLEISPSPRLYVAERCPGKVQSFEQRGGLVLVLDAGLLSSAARFDAGYAVQFALAHQMAAYALDQQRWSRQALAGLWASVRRSDLFSADALAAKLMNDRNEPVRALASLLCGPELSHLVDLGELERQTTSQEQEVQQHGDDLTDATYLLPRIAQLRKLAINGKV